jgi:xanthine dehydrogenase FAD-binding subunit
MEHKVDAQLAAIGRPPGEDITAIKTYAVPRSLSEAVALLRNGNVTVLAGSTDLMPQSKTGRACFKPVLMNIRRIPELCGVAETDGCVRFGALTTITELLDSTMVRTRFNALWQAADHFASDQLRNAATIGGNVCNASPAGDTLVPLLVFNARVVLASEANGAVTTRTLPLAEFFVGPGRTRRQPTELLTAVEVPLPPDGFVSEFYKFGVRPALDIAAIAIGVGAVRDGDRLRDVRIAFGAVAPTPIRAPKTEAALEGKPLPTAIELALAAAEVDIQPISDFRASEWYRRELVRNILRRMLDHVGNN